MIKNFMEYPTSSTASTEIYLTSSQNVRVSLNFDDFLAKELHRPDLASGLVKVLLLESKDIICYQIINFIFDVKNDFSIDL